MNEKIQQRRVKLGLAADEELYSYNSTATTGFNKLIPGHVAI